MLRHLKDKLVVLVTHQLQYLRRADLIIVMHEGSIQIQGTYDDIKSSEVSLAVLLEEAANIATSQPEPEKETEKVLKALSHTSTAFNSAIDIEGRKVKSLVTSRLVLRLVGSRLVQRLLRKCEL